MMQVETSTWLDWLKITENFTQTLSKSWPRFELAPTLAIFPFCNNSSRCPNSLCVDLFLATNCKWFNVGANNSQDAVWIIKIINFITGWELLKDPAGRDHFLSFLEKEYATENLLFVESVWHLKKLPVSEVREKRIGII